MKTKKRYIVILFIAALVSMAYLYWLIDSVPGVPILAYHKVDDNDQDKYSISQAEFSQHMQYLAENGYKAVSLKEMADSFSGKAVLPPKSIVITFDDGYEDNYIQALPIMEQYNMKGTVFVLAGQVGQTEYMTWEQIRAMQARGTEIGSHTVNHIALSEVDEFQRVQEVTLSKSILEKNLNTPVYFLAYPFGKFDNTMPDILKQAGYMGACTGITGLNTRSTDMYRLKRVNIPKPRFGLWEFKVRLLRAKIYGLIR